MARYQNSWPSIVRLAIPAQPAFCSCRSIGAGDASSNGIGLVFPSVCAGRGDTVERQVSSALGELHGALARAGSTLERVVKITLLLTDATEREAMHDALLAYWDEHAPGLFERPPATTFAQVRATAPAGARFLIDAVAVA